MRVHIWILLFTFIIFIILNCSNINEDLIEAVKSNDKIKVSELLQNGAKFNIQDKEGYTAWHLALLKGNIDIVKEFVKHGASINNKVNRKIEKGTLIIRRQQNIYSVSVDLDNTYPLFIVVLNNNINLTKLLLEAGGDPNIEDENGNTPIMVASAKGNIKIIKLLIKYGAQINHWNKRCLTPIVVGALNPSNKIEVIQLLLNKGALPDKLLEKVKNEELKKIEIYLENYFNNGEKFIEVCANGSLETLKALIKQGFGINSFYKYYYNKNHRYYIYETPLMAAARGGNFEAVKYLTSIGANINANGQNPCDRYSDITTALTKAAEEGNVKILRYLAENGADIKNQGGAALYKLITLGFNEKARRYYKPDPSIGHLGVMNEFYDYTPRHFKSKIEIVKLLVNLGANVNYAIKDKTTLLMAACKSFSVRSRYSDVKYYFIPLEVAEILINNGANVNAENELKETALIIATEENNINYDSFINNKRS